MLAGLVRVSGGKKLALDIYVQALGAIVIVVPWLVGVAKIFYWLME